MPAYTSIKEENGGITLVGAKNFLPDMVFDCGQCFRFNKTPSGAYAGVAFGKYIEVSEKDGDIFIANCTKADFENIWSDFFDLDFDYSDLVCDFADDETIIAAHKASKGIRILHQDKWETVCSFIISQNNNIPRIKKIIESMSAKYGKKVFTDSFGVDHYSFPDAKTLLDAGEDAIFSLKTGFRAKYIYDAAKKVALGELELSALEEMPYDEAMKILMSVKGIGPKVANCILLFSCRKYGAFPRDVWVNRILDKYYPSLTDVSYFGKNAGIIQQYLFYYERCKSGVYLS